MSNKNNIDIDTILAEAARSVQDKAEMDASMEKTAVLPSDHEDVVEFLGCAQKMAEISKRNGWPLALASVLPISNEPGSRGIALACATNLNGTIAANTFHVMKEKGLPAAMAFKAAAISCSQFGKIMEQFLSDKD